MGERVQWARGHVFLRSDTAISCVEEDGRRFWAVLLNKPWSLRQEFSSYEEAAEYIDSKDPDHA